MTCTLDVPHVTRASECDTLSRVVRDRLLEWRSQCLSEGSTGCGRGGKGRSQRGRGKPGREDLGAVSGTAWKVPAMDLRSHAWQATGYF